MTSADERMPTKPDLGAGSRQKEVKKLKCLRRARVWICSITDGHRYLNGDVEHINCISFPEFKQVPDSPGSSSHSVLESFEKVLKNSQLLTTFHYLQKQHLFLHIVLLITMLAFTTLTLALGLVPTAFAAPRPPTASSSTTTSGTITGSGTIQVVANTTSHSISWSTGSPSQSVACLNAVGQVVLDDCAVFTAVGNQVSTTAGVCSFQNTSQPTNTDDVYGKNVHAFLCWDHVPSSSDVQFYTVGGMTYNFLGQGDANLVSFFGSALHRYSLLSISILAFHDMLSHVIWFDIRVIIALLNDKSNILLTPHSQYYDVPSLPVTSTDAIDFWYFVWGGEETSVPAGHYQALLLWEPTS